MKKLLKAILKTPYNLLLAVSPGLAHRLRDYFRVTRKAQELEHRIHLLERQMEQQTEKVKLLDSVVQEDFGIRYLAVVEAQKAQKALS